MLLFSYRQLYTFYGEGIHNIGTRSVNKSAKLKRVYVVFCDETDECVLLWLLQTHLSIEVVISILWSVKGQCEHAKRTVFLLDFE